jgi:L-asparaginase II
MNPILVEATRGGERESAHRGAVAVVDADGAIVLAVGDVERLVFPRSAIKLLQALPLVASGAAERLGLGDPELAVACASHNGEPIHVDTVRGMLAKAGLDPEALECGTHWPSHGAAARQLTATGQAANALHNNCSGKHAGFLCLACALAAGGDARRFAKGYIDPDHPVMRAVTAAVATATDTDPDALPRGTDGCSIPAYAFPLRALALGFARAGTGRGLAPTLAAAAARLRAAVAAEPMLVGGTDRFDTEVSRRFGDRALTKVGAEGVFCGTVPGRALGVALKIDDGNNARAAEVVMAALLEALLQPEPEDLAFLRGVSDARLRNWNGIEVGRLRATTELRERLGPLVRTPSD